MKTDYLIRRTTNIETNKFPFAEFKIPAGFPSPALDYVEHRLDLNEYLNKHPNSTFIIRVKGDSMTGDGIFDEDLLIVDKSLTPSPGNIVIAELNGEFTVKRINDIKGRLHLISSNEKYDPIPVQDENELNVWGVVTYTIHKVY